MPPERRAEVLSWLRGADAKLLITSELPFSEWLARRSWFETEAAARSVEEGAEVINWLSSLPVPNVILSRPMPGSAKLRNEAILLRDGAVEPSHSKRHLPDEPGWSEAVWFERGRENPRAFDLHPLKVGILLCTEIMYPEDARTMGLAGVDLIAAPRATGPDPMWQAALAMAAISAGAYVISVNRVGGPFSGGASAFTPAGQALAPVQQQPGCSVFEIDVQQSLSAKLSYPRDVFRRD